MKRMHYAILMVIMVTIFSTPLFLLQDAEFGGADGTAEEIIRDQGYEPWFTSLWEPPSGEIETLIFSLQAGIGALIIGYFIGFERGKRAKNEPVKNESTVRQDTEN